MRASRRVFISSGLCFYRSISSSSTVGRAFAAPPVVSSRRVVVTGNPSSHYPIDAFDLSASVLFVPEDFLFAQCFSS